MVEVVKNKLPLGSFSQNLQYYASISSSSEKTHPSSLSTWITMTSKKSVNGVVDTNDNDFLGNQINKRQFLSEKLSCVHIASLERSPKNKFDGCKKLINGGDELLKNVSLYNGNINYDHYVIIGTKKGILRVYNLNLDKKILQLGDDGENGDYYDELDQLEKRNIKWNNMGSTEHDSKHILGLVHSPSRQLIYVFFKSSNSISIVNLSDGKQLRELKLKKKVTCLQITCDDKILMIGEEKHVRLIELDSEKTVALLKGCLCKPTFMSSQSIKINYCNDRDSSPLESQSTETFFLAGCNSTSRIFVWKKVDCLEQKMMNKSNTKLEKIHVNCILSHSCSILKAKFIFIPRLSKLDETDSNTQSDYLFIVGLSCKNEIILWDISELLLHHKTISNSIISLPVAQIFFNSKNKDCEAQYVSSMDNSICLSDFDFYNSNEAGMYCRNLRKVDYEYLTDSFQVELLFSIFSTNYQAITFGRIKLSEIFTEFLFKKRFTEFYATFYDNKLLNQGDMANYLRIIPREVMNFADEDITNDPGDETVPNKRRNVSNVSYSEIIGDIKMSKQKPIDQSDSENEILFKSDLMKPDDTSKNISITDKNNPKISDKVHNAVTKTKHDAFSGDSVLSVLVQSVITRDDDLFNRILRTFDAKVVKRTMKNFPPSLCPTLLKMLVDRFRSNSLSYIFENHKWLVSLLSFHFGYLSMNAQAKGCLYELSEIIGMRIKNLPALFKLQGKLAILSNIGNLNKNLSCDNSNADESSPYMSNLEIVSQEPLVVYDEELDNEN